MPVSTPSTDAPDNPAPHPSCVVICGKGRIAAGALSFTAHYAAARGLSFPILAAPNRDDRGEDTWQPSLIRAATALGLPCTDVDAHANDPGLLLVSLEYDRLVRVERFASSRLFNIHFSALPRYRGVFTSIWPILNGETTVGVTLHYMDPGVDTGRIVDQVTVPLPPYTSARQLYEVYLNEGLALFQAWLPRLIASVPAGCEQDESRASSYNRRSIDTRQVEVDLTRNAGFVCAFVRALYFPEYQHPTVGGRPVRACTAIPVASSAPPGTPLQETGYSTSFAVGDGGVVEVIWA